MSLISERYYNPESYGYTIEEMNIGKGAFNNIHLILLNDERLAILRTPINKKNIKSENAISMYHTKLFSSIVEQNVFPNFPLLYYQIVENNQYSIILEYANKYSLYDVITKQSLSAKQLKNVIIQTLLTLHYMNTILKISHNDATTPNILIKQITPKYISYSLNNKIFINMFAEYIALISDFDKTRGNCQNYDNSYILKHYIIMCCKKIYELHNITIELENINLQCKDDDLNDILYLKQLYHYMIEKNKDPTRFDILIFLIALYSYEPDNFREFFVNMVQYYIYMRKSIYFCIKKFLSSGISISKYKPPKIDNDNVFILYKNLLDFESMNYKNNSYLYHALLQNVYVRGNFLNSFFIKELNLYNILNRTYDIDCLINRKIIFKNIKLTSQNRKLLLDWLLTKVIFDFSDNKKSIVINIIDTITSLFPISSRYYQLLGIVVFYICLDQDFNIAIQTLIDIYKLKYSEYEFIQMINYLCYTLSNSTTCSFESINANSFESINANCITNKK